VPLDIPGAADEIKQLEDSHQKHDAQAYSLVSDGIDAYFTSTAERIIGIVP
jgi:hypothetical protein